MNRDIVIRENCHFYTFDYEQRRTTDRLMLSYLSCWLLLLLHKQSFLD